MPDWQQKTRNKVAPVSYTHLDVYKRQIPQWVTLEPRVFGWMDRLCEDYCGGIWNLYTLNNGCAFMAPEPDLSLIHI